MISWMNPELKGLLKQGGFSKRALFPFVFKHITGTPREQYRQLTMRTGKRSFPWEALWKVAVLLLLAKGAWSQQPPARATALPPTYNEKQMVPLSVDLFGNLRIAGTSIEYTGSATLDIGSVTDGACVLFATAIAVDGAALGGRPTIGMAFVPPEGVTVTAKVSAANEVKVQVCNATGAAYDPPSALYTIGVYQ